MSPSAFEAHCGAGSAKKWRASLRVVSAGCSAERWLAQHGIVPLGTRSAAGTQPGHHGRPGGAAGDGHSGPLGAPRAGGGMGAARRGLGPDGGASPRAPAISRAPAGLPKGPAWGLGDLTRLVSALGLSERCRGHAQSLHAMLALAAAGGPVAGVPPMQPSGGLQLLHAFTHQVCVHLRGGLHPCACPRC